MPLATDEETTEHTKEQSTTDHQKDVRLKRQEIRDEIKTFLMAGHDTTSTWLYWCLYALTKHRDVQEKLYKDIMKHVQQGNDSSITRSKAWLEAKQESKSSSSQYHKEARV